MNKIILTDVDGVLVDWLGCFDAYVKNHIMENVNTKEIDDINKFGPVSIAQKYDITPVMETELAHQFITSPHIRNLPAIKNSTTVIPHLHEQGFKFLGLTSISDDDIIKQNRMYNLENLYGKNIFLDCICLTTGKDKLNKLKEIKNIYQDEIILWVEDHTQNAIDGYNLGFDTFIMDHDYNRTLNNDGIKRASDWNDIQKYVIANHK